MSLVSIFLLLSPKMYVSNLINCIFKAPAAEAIVKPEFGLGQFLASLFNIL